MQALLAAIAIMVVHGHCVHCTLAYKLDQLQFVSHTEGWAAAFVIESNGHVSQNSALVHTTDGGKHWRQLPDVETYGVEVEPAFWFLDAKNGWVTWPVASTAEDHLIRTHDGGRSWRNGRAHGYLPHIRFFTDRVGVAVESTGDKPLFLSTTNGGADWHRQPLELDFPSLSQFLSPNVGWVAGDARGRGTFVPRVLSTSDGGKSWRSSYMPGGVQGTPRDMFFSDDAHGWLILWNGGTEDLNTLLWTNDGGQSWQENLDPAFHRNGRQFDCVRFLSASVGFVFVRDGNAAAVLMTRNGGETWHEEPLPSPVQSCTIVGNEVWCGSGMELLKIKSSK